MTRRAIVVALLLAATAPAARATPGLMLTSASTPPTGSNPEFVTTGDFNGDGIPDLVTANFGAATVSVLLGTGGGSFSARTDFATGTKPEAVAVGDFNRDGIPDLVTANFGADTVSVLLGTGAGSFSARTDFATAHQPRSVAVGDFDHDGIQDLAVAAANSGNGTLSVLLGTGAGGFGPKTDYVTVVHASWIAIGDFNEDGRQDLAAANDTSGGGLIGVHLGNGSGTFGAVQAYSTGPVPGAIAAADFNRDGHLDLVTANQQGGTVSVLLGGGNGTFGAPATFPVGGSAISVAVGDLNADGDPDLAVANIATGNVSVLLGTGTGSFGTTHDFPSGGGSFSVAVADFNGDGFDDLVGANSTAGTVRVLRNAPVATMPAGPIAFGAQPVGLPTAAQTVTVTNDGFAPLRVAGLAFGGANPDDFLITSTSCHGPVPSGGTCDVGVAFAPQALGSRAATLTVTGNAATSTVALTGTGDDNSLTGSPGANGADGATGPSGATGVQGVAGDPGAPGAKGAKGTAGKLVVVTCTVRYRRHARRVRVRCVAVTQHTTQALAWRLTRGGRTVAHGRARPHGGRIHLDLGGLRPGRYELTLGDVHRHVIVRHR